MLIKLTTQDHNTIERIVHKLCEQHGIEYIDNSQRQTRFSSKKEMPDFGDNATCEIVQNWRYEVMQRSMQKRRGRFLYYTTYVFKDANSEVRVKFVASHHGENLAPIVTAKGARHSLANSFTSTIFNELIELKDSFEVIEYRTAAPDAGWWEHGVADKAVEFYAALDLIAENTQHFILHANEIFNALAHNIKTLHVGARVKDVTNILSATKKVVDLAYDSESFYENPQSFIYYALNEREKVKIRELEAA